MSMKVLIADGSKAERSKLRRLLSKVKNLHLIFEAGDVDSAIDVIRSHYPDTIIIDIHLSRNQGFKILDYLIHHDLEMLVVVLTRLTDISQRRKSYELGAHYFLDKAGGGIDKLVRLMQEYA